MPFFRCFIRGENFPGTLLGQKERVGFYTTRFVAAESPEQAELGALELLRNDPGLDVVAEHRSEDAQVYFDEIEEIPADADKRPGSGFTFFTMGT